MKIFFGFLILLIAGFTPIFPNEFILDYRIESEDPYNEERFTIVKSPDNSIIIYIIISQGKVIVERWVKNPNLKIGIPKNFSAFDMAHMGVHLDNWIIIHKED